MPWDCGISHGMKFIHAKGKVLLAQVCAEITQEPRPKSYVPPKRALRYRNLGFVWFMFLEIILENIETPFWCSLKKVVLIF